MNKAYVREIENGKIQRHYLFFKRERERKKLSKIQWNILHSEFTFYLHTQKQYSNLKLHYDLKKKKCFHLNFKMLITGR